MIKIDGSYGEGGGQIVRNTIALSVLTQTPVEIYNIRKKRKNPGLKAQHYSAVKLLKDISNAQTQGLAVGSKKLVFKPGEIKPGEYKLDIKTAGSIVLVFQTSILACMNTKKPISILCEGGTDVAWAPCWDYFKCVFLPMLQKIGINVDAQLEERGYYPRGGGRAQIKINPHQSLKALKLDFTPCYTHVNGFINISNLADHINKRMKHSVQKKLVKHNLKSNIKTNYADSLSPGVGITLFSENNRSIIGSCTVGKKGIPAEKIGSIAADMLLKEIESDSTMDIHLYDQLLPYLAYTTKCDTTSCRVRKITNHAQTCNWLCKKFIDYKINIDKEQNYFKINFS